MLKETEIFLDYNEVLDLIILNLDSIKPFILFDVAQIFYVNHHNYFITIRIDLSYSKFHVIYFKDDKCTLIERVDVLKRFVKKKGSFYYIDAPEKRDIFHSDINEELIEVPKTNDEWFNLLMTNDLTEEYFIKFKEIIEYCEKLLNLFEYKK